MPWTEEPGRLQSIVAVSDATEASYHAGMRMRKNIYMHTRTYTYKKSTLLYLFILFLSYFYLSNIFIHANTVEVIHADIADKQAC